MQNEGSDDCSKGVQNEGGKVGARISRLFLFLYLSALEGSRYFGRRISLRLSSSSPYHYRTAVSLVYEYTHCLSLLADKPNRRRPSFFKRNLHNDSTDRCLPVRIQPRLLNPGTVESFLLDQVLLYLYKYLVSQ